MWEELQLGELLTESKEVSLSPNPDKRITVRLNCKGVEKRPLTNTKEGNTKYYERKVGQFIYGKQNLFKGAFGVIPAELDGFESTIDLPAFDVDDRLNVQWLIWWLKRNEFYKSLVSIAKGSATRRIHPNDFLKIKIPLPTRDEQDQIVNQLNKDALKINSILKYIEELQVNCNTLKNSILRDAIQGKLIVHEKNKEQTSELLQKIKIERLRLATSEKEKKKLTNEFQDIDISSDIEGWIYIKAELICDNITKGTTPKSNELLNLGDVPYLKVYNIVNNKIDFDYRPQFVTSKIHNTFLQRSRVFPYDVLMNIVGPPLGKVAIVTDQYPEWNINQALAIFRPIKYVLPEFLYFTLVEGKPIRDIQTVGTAGQDNISLTQCREIKIPIPPLEEQRRIVEKVNELMDSCNEILAKIEESKKETEKFMRSLLLDAFKVNDEPIN
ncbi:restriction endonuclease subunit S [Mesobacillus jeotgali]|uniref:restriction endonuclease subunit S n=1 Tax=Mesobacillus jeotgali TaxID=129985 RepID=UPI0009A754A1|nr:restriction endonuclease subunit S [Mesobacillus jeotgali]